MLPFTSQPLALSGCDMEDFNDVDLVPNQGNSRDLLRVARSRKWNALSTIAFAAVPHIFTFFELLGKRAETLFSVGVVRRQEL
jgi:hypothetical protein